MEIKTHYKVELVRRGKRVKDLAHALDMDYAKISRILNGFAHEPADFGSRFYKTLSDWDNQKTG